MAAFAGLGAPALGHARPHAKHRARVAASGGVGLGVNPAASTAVGVSPAAPTKKVTPDRSAPGAAAPVAGAALPSGPATPSTPAHPTVPGLTGQIIGGVAYAPASAPLAVQQAIWAGNQIRLKPYIYGGGHASFQAPGYDCSGSVSYVLHAAGLLKTPMDSSDLLSWGVAGIGQWITVYTNPAHAFVEIAGIRLDTSSEGDPGAARGTGPRWRVLLTNTSGYTPRTYTGF
jgi:cell wall-associated NlpC family hydrolase